MSDADYLAKHYPHVSNRQLARILGRAVASIQRQATKMHLHKATFDKKRDLTGDLLAIAERKEYFHLHEVPLNGGTIVNIWRSADRLRRRGKLFKITLSHKDVVYTKHIDVVRRLQAKLDAEAKPAGVTIKHYGRAWWDKDAPMIMTEKTKITIAEKKIPALLRTNTHGEIG
jgi:hypothetical protein